MRVEGFGFQGLGFRVEEAWDLKLVEQDSEGVLCIIHHSVHGERHLVIHSGLVGRETRDKKMSKAFQLFDLKGHLPRVVYHHVYNVN